MIVVELTAAIDSIGTLQTYYISDQSYVSTAVDVPAHTVFEPRLIDPGDISISIYRDGPSGGVSALEYGEMIFANLDGEFDDWKKKSFDGRQVVIRVGEAGDAYPANFTTVFVGTAASVTLSWDQVIVDLRDKAYVFNKAILTQVYAGTNVGATGLEGTSNDIGGSLKPFCMGSPQEVAPPCVNTSLLVYQVNNGPVINIPYVAIRQAPLTQGLNYATSALMMAAPIPTNQYITCFNEGMFRVNTQDGQVTCNVIEATGRTAANMLQTLAQRAGLGTDEINFQDITILGAKSPYQLGVYIDDDTTYIDLMNQIAQSVGAWFAFDTFGVLRMGRLESPSSQPVDVLHEYDILTPIERTILQNEPTPTWQVSINHTKIYTVQTSGLVGTVSPDRLAFLAKEYRTATTSDPNVLTQYKLATSFTIDSLLTSQQDAQLETNRLVSLHGRPYDVFNVAVDVNRFAELTNKGLTLGKELGLDLPRFGLSGGFSFITLGISYQRGAKHVTLTLWGGNVPAAQQKVVVESIGIANGTGVAYSASIVSAAGLAVGSGQANSSTSGIVAGAGLAIGNGTAHSTTSTVTGQQGQPFGFLLLLTQS